MLHVVVAGGGTAGHIEPALNLADEIMRRHPDAKVTALGTAKGLEVDLIPARGYNLKLIPAAPLPRKLSLDLFLLPIRLRIAIAETRAVLRELNADVLIGFGGYVSIPAYLAARGRMPIIVHEANAKPGLANRVGAQFAAAVAESVSGSMPTAINTGIPLRAAIANLDRAKLRFEARAHFGITNDNPTLLVFGGSQGAQSINRVIEQAKAQGLVEEITIIHAVGKKNDFAFPKSANYFPLNYIDRMDLAYAAADFVIARSGAMSVAEISAVGLPACFIPLPIGNGEQRVNALPVVKAGGAILIDNADFDVAALVNQVLPILNSPAQITSFSLASKSCGRQDASSRLADVVDHVVEQATKKVN
jgi:UDP-N-acetylglucosamine--N-acetylmuramyl-(pentapeptide) pyrophosphoryl-undecaprenol N-acetylglucosamine transferase